MSVTTTFLAAAAAATSAPLREVCGVAATTARECVWYAGRAAGNEAGENAATITGRSCTSMLLCESRWRRCSGLSPAQASELEALTTTGQATNRRAGRTHALAFECFSFCRTGLLATALSVSPIFSRAADLAHPRAQHRLQTRLDQVLTTPMRRATWTSSKHAE